jgi:hypothetical protein
MILSAQSNLAAWPVISHNRRWSSPVPSAGPIIPPRSLECPWAGAFPVATLTQLLFTRWGAWAVMGTNETAGYTRPIVGGELSLSCDEATWKFVDQNNLTESVMDYITLADKCFNLVETPSCRLVRDPENDDEYLMADVHIQGDTKDILGSERRFRGLLVKQMSSEFLYRIRLSYHIK